ncbi:MAG TPA: translation initiation factor IF-2 [Firmicutes bacterium]|nr:translation initiation factor IF-2 [Bacillota bacterium]
MTKMRVHEFSKELGIKSKDLIRLLNEMNAGVKNHMSTVDEEIVAQVRSFFNTGGGKQSKPVAPPKVESPSAQNTSAPTKEPAKARSGAADKKAPKAKEVAEKRQTTRPAEKDRVAKETLKKTEAVNVRKSVPAQRSSQQAKPVQRRDDSRPAPRSARPQETAVGKRPTPSGEKRSRTPQAGRPEARTGRQGQGQKQSQTQGKRKDNVQPSRGRGRARGQSTRAGNVRRSVKPAQPTTNVKSVQIPADITVKEFAQAIEVAVGEVIKKLMGLGVMATINQTIDLDTAILLGEEFKVEVTGAPTAEEELRVEEVEDDPASLVTRWPVVSIMGHVDHGKTSLLDAIRETNVTATEAGGITQHIGAYQVNVDGKKITFLDTPGHEAFTAMRARGAQATDIAILVVAADDGVMPQTVEAINHARAADIPIIVAINKMDKPTANPERVKQELTQYELVPEEWGGDTICVEVSAKKRANLDQLLEMILLVAEIKEFKANPNRPAMGVIIESKLDKGRGPVATVLVKNGTLKVGDNIIAGKVSGKIRALVNDLGKKVKKAGPSAPVEIVGLDDLPEAGDTFYVTDEKTARELATKRQQFSKEQEFKKQQKVSLDDLFDRIKEGEMKELNIIIKADVNGSVEAIRQSLEQITSDEVKIQVIHGGAGAINENDVLLASASNAIIIGFNVRPDPAAKRTAEREKVDIRLYRVIYTIIDDVKNAMEGMLAPEFQEVVLGRAEVRAVFKVPKVGTVAGSYVTEGKITRNSEARLLRDNVVIYEGKIESLKRFKDDVKEVTSGFECGIGLERYNDLKEGDVIESFINEEIKKTGV